jgi:glycosyltransferase involved in cell wall biosynthesis
MGNSKVLIVFLEPTPYIIGLLERLKERWQPGLHVMFAGTNLSQQWNLPANADWMEVLPNSRWKLFLLLRERMRSNAYCVLHLAGWAGHPALLSALLMARHYGMAVTMETDTPRPHISPLWKRCLKRLWYPLLFRLPTRFLPGGTRQATYLKDYGVSQERITIARMTVDVSAIAAHKACMTNEDRIRVRLAYGLTLEQCVFLYVGRLEPHKGLQELLAAFQRLEVTEDTKALMLVGVGSMYDELKDAARADPLMRCPGRLSGADLLDVYAVADVFVLPSRFEPWGLVVNEAMAAGLPVLATERVGCVDDLVRAGETGMLVPAESVLALTAAMQKLFDDQALRKNMGNNATALIAGWTLEQEADTIVGSWKQIVGSQ